MIFLIPRKISPPVATHEHKTIYILKQHYNDTLKGVHWRYPRWNPVVAGGALDDRG